MRGHLRAVGLLVAAALMSTSLVACGGASEAQKEKDKEKLGWRRGRRPHDLQERRHGGCQALRRRLPAGLAVPARHGRLQRRGPRCRRHHRQRGVVLDVQGHPGSFGYARVRQRSPGDGRVGGWCGHVGRGHQRHSRRFKPTPSRQVRGVVIGRGGETWSHGNDGRFMLRTAPADFLRTSATPRTLRWDRSGNGPLLDGRPA